MVLESANFNPAIIRRGSRELGLKTDASLRTTVLANARKALTTARNHLAKALELNLKLANTAAQYLASYNSTENTILAVEKFKD